MEELQVVDARGYRRSAATMPGFQRLCDGGVEAAGHRVFRRLPGDAEESPHPGRLGRAWRVQTDEAEVAVARGHRDGRGEHGRRGGELDADPARAVVEPGRGDDLAAVHAERRGHLGHERLVGRTRAHQRRRGTREPAVDTPQLDEAGAALPHDVFTLVAVKPRVAGTERRVPGKGELAGELEIRTR